MMMINKEKMSKSLGNFFTIRELLEKYDGEVLRYFLLSAQYRSQLNYSVDNLDQAKAGLSRLYTALRNVDVLEPDHDSEYLVRFKQAMDDDFNTPLAYAVLFDLAKEINTLKSSDKEKAGKLAGLLKELGDVLGLLAMDPEEFLKGAVDKSDVDVDLIEAIIKERNDARKEKNWAVADAARKKLADMGVVIEDGPNGTTWRKN